MMVDADKKVDEILDFLLEEAQVRLVEVAESIKKIDSNNKRQIERFVKTSGKKVYNLHAGTEFNN